MGQQSNMFEVGKTYEIYFDDKRGVAKRAPAKVIAQDDVLLKINSPAGKGELITKALVIRAVPINEKEEGK